jgi:hypothetical protein
MTCMAPLDRTDSLAHRFTTMELRSTLETRTTLDQTLDELISQGIDPDVIAKRARERASKATKDYFIQDLFDEKSEAYVVQLTVSDWDTLQAFFSKPTTEDFHPQRIFQDIANDIKDAVATQDAQLLILSLLLGAKALQP